VGRAESHQREAETYHRGQLRAIIEKLRATQAELNVTRGRAERHHRRAETYQRGNLRVTGEVSEYHGKKIVFSRGEQRVTRVELRVTRIET
jgi:hypothetical protein